MPQLPGGQRADIEMMSGGGGECDEAPFVKHRHDEGKVRPVAGAAIGVVVHDHVTGPHRIPAFAQRFQDAADVTRNRPDCSGVDWADSVSPRPSASTNAAPKSSDSRIIDE
jgi:hypothetical protein